MPALPALAITGLWLVLLWRWRYSGYGIAVLSLPGTVLHEFMHYLVGALLRAEPVSVSLWPRREGNYWVLGSVGFARLRLWNAAFVALAPLLLLPAGYGLILLVEAAWLAEHYLIGGCLGYLAACALFACAPSVTDLKVGGPSIALYGLAAYLLWQAGS